MLRRSCKPSNNPPTVGPDTPGWATTPRRLVKGAATRSAMRIRIRAATLHDQGGLARLRAELWPERPPERHAAEILARLTHPGTVVLAEAQEGLVGFAEVSVRDVPVEAGALSPVPFLEGWYVTRSRRGQGIGRSLLRSAERWAVTQGHLHLASDAAMHHALCLHLHTHLGFHEIGRTVHFLKDLSKT